MADKSKYYTSTGAENVYFYPEAQYSYDIYGNLTNSTFALIDDINEKKYAVNTSYTYDKNRLSAVSVPNRSNAQYSFYDDGKLKSVTYPALSDGSIIKSEYVYDGLSRLKTLTNKKDSTVLSSYSYTYDSNGNILTTTETVGDKTNTTAYTYDKLNRISSVSGTKNADSYYEYDYRGNRKVNFEQNDFLSEENAAYSYDLLENMTYSETGDDTTIIRYGTNGYRYVKRDNSDMPEYYVYDQNGRLQAEAMLVNATVNGTSGIIMYPEYQYVWGADRVLAQFDVLNNKLYYYLYNGHGDVIQIVDESGNIVNSYDYDVWGNFLEKEETVHNPFTYFGQTYDEATGLYYLRARYYDPQTGRFTQQDTAEDGYNWYVYGNQNPVLYVDYTGDVAITVSAGVATVLKAIFGFAVTIGTTYTLNNIVKNISSNRKHHILHGSNNSHEDGWRKFNVDPNDPKGFEKLLPIINEVIRHGTKGHWQEKGERYVREITYYFPKIGETVMVIINKTKDGIESITDAYTIFK